MKQYLEWFDSLMERPTLLLMDNFSAHILAWDSFSGESAVKHLK